MSIFEDLENLNVSEECFDDVIGTIKGLLNEGDNLKGAVRRAYRNKKIGVNKSVELENKADRIPSSNDIHVNDEGDTDFSNLTGKTSTKSGLGELKTDMRREKNGRDEDELAAKRWGDEKNKYRQAIAKAIRRHKEKGGVKESLVEELVEIVEAYINEISDELAHAASAETTKRYYTARNAVDYLKGQLKHSRDFYTADEIKGMKKDLKAKEKDFEEAKRKRIRDNHNRLNRDIRLGKV